jgi:hypothetical protein
MTLAQGTQVLVGGAVSLGVLSEPRAPLSRFAMLCRKGHAPAAQLCVCVCVSVCFSVNGNACVCVCVRARACLSLCMYCLCLSLTCMGGTRTSHQRKTITIHRHTHTQTHTHTQHGTFSVLGIGTIPRRPRWRPGVSGAQKSNTNQQQRRQTIYSNKIN